MKTVVISQPTYLPWLGYFRLMKEADTYVFLDNVQFARRSWQCRNRIKSPTKWIWLTIPTFHKGLSLIKDVEIDNSKPWARQHRKALQLCYGKAPYFAVHFPFFKSVYKKTWQTLVDLNIKIIEYLASQLQLSPVYIRSSQLNIEGKRTDLLLDICRTLNADRYVSSIGAEEYMMEDDAIPLFRDEGITVDFLEYKHPKYPQLFGAFVPGLSTVDCLFNCGPDSSKIISNQKLTRIYSYD